MNNGLKFEKTRIREAMLEQRLAIPEELRHEADTAMAGRFVNLATFRFAEVILLYAPIKAEPNVLLCCEAALKAGKRLAFPRCHPDTCTMTYGIVSSLDDLVEGAYGILEPREDAEIYVPAPYKHDICVVPAVCFDKKGYRIGYGKGYYDRYLKRKQGITTLGIAFQCQQWEYLIPNNEFDIPLDKIITEKNIFN